MTIADEIHAERVRAHEKHRHASMEVQPADDPVGKRLRILLEEVGEVAKVWNDAEVEGRPVDLVEARKELVQCGAMIESWIGAIDGEPLSDAPGRD